MYQAILTHYIGASSTRNARVIAKAGAGRISVEWNSSLNYENNHVAAAKALAEKYGWKGDWIGGGTPEGCCFVCVTDGGIDFVTTGMEYGHEPVNA